MASYRKKKNGEWVIYGTTDEVKPHTNVVVVKKNGEATTEFIRRVGKSFDVDGTTMVYGYPVSRPFRKRRAVDPADACDNCSRGRATTEATDSSGIPGMVCDRCSYLEHYELSFA